MNAAAALRNEIVRHSQLSFQRLNIGGIPTSKWPNLKPFKAVDYAEYLSKMQATKEELGPSYDNTYDVEKNYKPPMSGGEKLSRMFTTFPLRDPAYLVVIFFIIGSIDFTINGAIGLIPIINPEGASPELMAVWFPTTIFIGAGFFLFAGILDLLGAFNAENGLMEITKNSNGGKDLTHRPALLGSKEWSWGTNGRFMKLLKSDVAFQSGFSQFLAGLIFTISAFTTIPGLFDPMSPSFPLIAFFPQVVGGFMFFAANAVLAYVEQDHFWGFKPFSANWQSGFLGAGGGLGFMMGGLLLLLSDFPGAAWASMIGSVSFLLGSIAGWYSVMEMV
ncbi:unnamed protein product [Periconia digitata]|uniref:Integral membrane protein n=1 Tax=Periconia digitata TaxID=1303443 RepID=A0A9W4U695_9PLEO|nr:unnamed protein product [Periconia digitata]